MRRALVMKEKYLFIRCKMLSLILIYFSLSLHFLVTNSFENFDATSVNEFRSVALCIAEVSKQELVWRPTIVLKVEENQTDFKSDFIKEITKVFATENSPYFSTNNISDFHGNYIFLDYFENSEALLNFDFDVIKMNMKYLWILDNYSENFGTGDFQSVGNRVGKYDVTFLMKASETEYKIVTFFPTIDSKTCKETVRNYLQINTCEDGCLKRNVTFPAKNPTNLKRCPLKVGLSSLYPFSIIDNKESLKTYDSLEGVKFQGMDVELLKIISSYFNATLDLRYIFKYEENPFTHTEYLPFLLNGSLDLCAGGLYRIFGDLVAYSGVYSRQTVIWIYTAERPAISWQNLIANIGGLYIFIIFYIAYSVVWYIICVFDRNAVSLKTTLLYAWGALVGTASLQDARSLKQKMLNLTYLIMCLHLSVYISIQFYSYLTIHGPPEILKSNDDVMTSGRTPFLHSLTKYFVSDDKYVQFANSSMECAGFLNCTLEILKYKGVTIMLEAYYFEFQADTIVNDEARLLRPMDNVLLVYYEMLISKNSFIVKNIQKVVGRLFEAGITIKLFVEAIGAIKVDKVNQATRNIMSNSYSCQEGCAITFEQISGAFYLWAICCGLAFIVFIMEMLIKKDRNNKTWFESSIRPGFKVKKIL